MPAAPTDFDLELLTGTNFAQFVTLSPDGTPHATVTWVDASAGHVLVNTAAGRKKDRNVQRDSRVAVCVVHRDDPYRWITVQGTVVERLTGEEADAHIDSLSRKYDGEPWSPVEGQVRVQYRIRPDQIIRHRE